MSLAQRISRLEDVEYERELRWRAERLAERYGLSVDDAVRRFREVIDRVARWGMEEELRRIARQHGKSEEEARADYERIVAELRAEGPAQFGREDGDRGRGG